MNLPQPGSMYAGLYWIRRELGEGGFAVVYDADDAETQQRVALKVLKPQSAGSDRDVVQRFQRELDVLSGLKSANIVELLDHGTSPDGSLFAAFEFLEGVELRRLIGKEGLNRTQVRAVLRQLASALDAAHRAGLLHRDIKPENVMIVAQEPALVVKLIDFGIARALDDRSPAVTKTGQLVGTPRYMSPEQLTGSKLTPRSDLYAVGLLGWEMVLGAQALQGNSVNAQLDRMMPGFRFEAPELEAEDASLFTLLTAMTARVPDERPANAAAVLRALADEPPVAEPPHWSRRVPARAAVATPVLFVALVLALVFADGREDHEGRRALPPALVQTAPPRSAPPDPEPPAEPVDLGRVATVEPGRLACLDAKPPFPLDQISEVAEGSLYVPPQYVQNVPTPIVVLLRDVDKTESEFLEQSGFVELAREHGFLVLALRSDQGLAKRPWKFVDDLKAVENGPVPLQKWLCVDEQRMFLVGHGYGTHAGPCRAAWASAVAFAGVPQSTGCGAEVKKVEWVPPTLLVYGRDSPGHTLFGERNCKGKRPPTLAATMEQWTSHLSCDAPDGPAFRRLERGTRCVEQRCLAGAVLQTCIVDGGRPWPGMSPRSSLFKARACDGPALQDDVAKRAWQFFERVTADVEPAEPVTP